MAVQKDPPRRVRVHVQPPLPERRAWLQLPQQTAATIHDCKKLFAMQLGLQEDTALELSLVGFALLDTSLVSILDSDKDVIEITSLQPSTSKVSEASSHAAGTSKRRKLNK